MTPGFVDMELKIPLRFSNDKLFSTQNKINKASVKGAKVSYNANRKGEKKDGRGRGKLPDKFKEVIEEQEERTSMSRLAPSVSKRTSSSGGPESYCESSERIKKNRIEESG